MSPIGAQRYKNEEIEELINLIVNLINKTEDRLTAHEVQKRLNGSRNEAIAKALRVSIERGNVIIDNNMNLSIRDLAHAEVGR